MSEISTKLPADAEPVLLLGAALAIGLLIGAERGWKRRQAKEGERVAGFRTYGLIGLLGGCAGLLANYLGEIVFGAVFLGFAGAAAFSYVKLRPRDDDASATGLVAMLITFLLGVLATLGQITLAAAAGVITALLLRLKAEMHGWLKQLEEHELLAALQLLLISVVMLPILPNRGFGPWQAINPYEIWWMVVLIASVSFVGYFAMKLVGARKGVLLTALFAGIASSTALTLSFSRLARARQDIASILAAGILVACGMMFARMLLVVGVVNPDLVRQLWVPLAVMSLLTLTIALGLWFRGVKHPIDQPTTMRNPLDLQAALVFGMVLMLVVLLSEAAKQFFGDTGLYILATVSGIADVDPISLSLARMSRAEVDLHVAITGIVIAASMNTLVKAGLAASIGGGKLAVRVFFPLLLVVGAGLSTAWLMQPAIPA